MTIVYTMHNVSDENIRYGASTQSSDLGELREYAAYQESLDRRVIIVEHGGRVAYLSPARRTELERTYRNAPITKGQLRDIRAALTDRDLVRETRPAYRHRMQVLKSDPRRLNALTWGQAEALINALEALPFDDSIDHTAFVIAIGGHITASAYEDRCADDVCMAYAQAKQDLGMQRHQVLFRGFAY